MINNVFTESDFNQKTLTEEQKTKFKNYLKKIRKLIISFTESIKNMKYCTDYVAKGMGLVACEQNRKATFFLYPIPKDYPLQDIEVKIKGPYSTTGSIIVPAIVKKTSSNLSNYQRSMYLSGKLSSISPTLQGSTFLRTLSKNYGGDVNNDIKIRIKVTKNNTKVSYIPKKSGIHDISLTTNGSHLIGSPFSVVVDPPSSKSISDDSLSENEIEYKEISRKYIPAVVDVNGEKMFLKENGTLEKIKREPLKNIFKDKNPTDNNSNNFEVQNKNFYELPKQIWNSNEEGNNSNKQILREKVTSRKDKDDLILSEKVPKNFVDNWVEAWEEMDLNSNKSNLESTQDSFIPQNINSNLNETEINLDQNWNNKNVLQKTPKYDPFSWGDDIQVSENIPNDFEDDIWNELLQDSNETKILEQKFEDILNYNHVSLEETITPDDFEVSENFFGQEDNFETNIVDGNISSKKPYFDSAKPNSLKGNMQHLNLKKPKDEQNVSRNNKSNSREDPLNFKSLEENINATGNVCSKKIHDLVQPKNVLDIESSSRNRDDTQENNFLDLSSIEKDIINDTDGNICSKRKLIELESERPIFENPYPKIDCVNTKKDSNTFNSKKKNNIADEIVCSKSCGSGVDPTKPLEQMIHVPEFTNSQIAALQNFSTNPFKNSEAIYQNTTQTSLEKKFLTSSFEVLTTNFEEFFGTSAEVIHNQNPLQIMNQIQILKGTESLKKTNLENQDVSTSKVNETRNEDMSWNVQDISGTNEQDPERCSSELVPTETPQSLELDKPQDRYFQEQKSAFQEISGAVEQCPEKCFSEEKPTEIPGPLRTESTQKRDNQETKDTFKYDLEPNSFHSSTNFGTIMENQIQVLGKKDQENNIKLFEIQDDQGTRINILEETGKILVTELNPKLEDTEVFLDCLENDLPLKMNQNLSTPVTPDILEVPVCESQSFVQEKTFDFEYVRKTFSKKDPSYEIVENIKMEAFKPTKKISTIVNLFESKSQSTKIVEGSKVVVSTKMVDRNKMVERDKMVDSFKMADNCKLVENSPDLVKCHSYSSSSSKYIKFQKLVPENLYTKNLTDYKLLNKKLKKWGCSYKNFDKNQRFLKCLVIHDLKNIAPSSNTELPIKKSEPNFRKTKLTTQGLAFQRREKNVNLTTDFQNIQQKTKVSENNIENRSKNQAKLTKFSFQINNLSKPSFPVRKMDKSRLNFDSTETKISKVEPKIIETQEGIVDYKIKELTSKSQENLQKDIPTDLKFLPGGLVKNKLKIFEAEVFKIENKPSLPRKSRPKIIKKDTNIDIDKKIVSEKSYSSFDEKFQILQIEVFKENESKVLERLDNDVADSSKTNDIPKRMLNKEIKIKEKQKQRFERAKNFFKTLEKSRDEVVETNHSDEDCDNAN